MSLGHIKSKAVEQSVINVTNINTTYFDMQTNKAYPGGELKGFEANTGKSVYYTFTVNYRNSTYSETIENISATTSGFSVVKVVPALPSIIQPNSAQTFNLAIDLPNTSYAGPLNLLILYKVNYVTNSSKGQ